MKQKPFILISIFLFFTTCSRFDFQTIGTIVEKEFLVASFKEIIVHTSIQLFIIESPQQKVIVETGENLFPDIVLKVTDNLLEVSIKNDFPKNFDVTKVYIYSPNLTKIRNSSVFPVHSIGVLNYASLELISENYLSDYLNSGDFNLELNTQDIKIIANGTSIYNLKGFSKNININFAGNNPRFEGKDLLVEKAYLYARSTNDILIKVTDEISGNLYSTGDVILFKKPINMNLKTHYTGKVIFN